MLNNEIFLIITKNINKKYLIIPLNNKLGCGYVLFIYFLS